ncbi:MAG: MATE family efflux transporter [Myxococcales bacterium]|nr:MAG: MATE family efflux transporter [Myxococcales bacterium]
MRLLMLDRKLSRDVVKLAAPVVLGMVAQTSVNLADTIMVGWMKDEVQSVAGVAAIGITLPLYWAVGGFLSALAVGTQALTARRFGEGKPEGSGRVLYNSLSAAFIFGAFASIVGALLIPFVFPFFNSNPDVVRLGIPYAQLRFLGVLSMVATIGYKAFFDGIGKTYVHMTASIVMNVVNIILSALFIFGLFGFPEMGVVGAGLANTIASYMGMGIMVAWSFKPEIIATYRHYRRSNFNWPVLREIVRLSLPGGLATIVVMSGFLLFMKIVGHIDQQEWLASFPRASLFDLHRMLNEALAGGRASDLLPLASGLLPAIDGLTAGSRSPLFAAGTKVIIDLMSISFMSAMAIGTATATLISQNLGRGKPRLAEQYGWEAVRISFLTLGMLGFLEVIFPEFFLHLFTNKAAVIEASAFSLRMVGVVNFMVAAGLIFMQALFGAGNAKFVMYVEFTLHFTCLVPLAYLFGIHWNLGMEGVWLSAIVYVVSLSSILAWKFWQGKWKYIKI